MLFDPIPSILFFIPLTAWAYFDPGFGGYFINSLISLIATGFAFLSAAVIYFFRISLGRRSRYLWQKYPKPCLIVLLTVIGIGSFFLGSYLHHHLFKRSGLQPPFSGPRIIDPQRICPGYNLYNGNLIDGKGRIVKQWPANYGVIGTNGDFYGLVNMNEPPWSRYNWNGKVIWEKPFSIHNGIWPTPRGTIIVFPRKPTFTITIRSISMSF